MRSPSKRTVYRLRKELDAYVLGKGRPLINGYYTRLPIDEQLASMLRDYATALYRYLLANGIQVENTYLDPVSRKSKYIILDSTSSKYITWSLSSYHLVVPDRPIVIHMDGSSGASYGLQVTCNVIPCSTVDELLQQFSSSIDRLDGEKLCDACHYSVEVNKKLCCGMGMVPTAHCTGYIRSTTH